MPQSQLKTVCVRARAGTWVRSGLPREVSLPGCALHTVVQEELKDQMVSPCRCVRGLSYEQE